MPHATGSFSDPFLLPTSREYSRELGEKLKARVFHFIFRDIATGFLRDRKQRLGVNREPGDEELADIFEATLTLLYRLLFLLYAESRDLLPIREAPYYAASLKKMKEGIADKAGVVASEVAERLNKAYSPKETALYNRLSRLFAALDKGDPKLNVPTFKGGLFNTTPDKSGRQEKHIASFLTKHKVPDRVLALAIDRLARDQDARTLDLEFIDYQSLEVRHLGSIYEGLLEFALNTADEDVATRADKKGVRYVPLSKAKPSGRRKPAEVVVRKGDLYLSNDNPVRKTSGSYYTPDAIVKYIVAHTVGPVLEEKLEALRPKFRGAATFNEPKNLVEELFDLRVLDPAMGSGHFLVETVDYLTDHLLKFLNEFPINPVNLALDRMRHDILKSLRKQGVTVDPSKLSAIHLLRRHVLEHCIYGVDMNPMAVELAKVGLWLHAGSLGTPPDLLDHHLLCGNSLMDGTSSDLANESRAGFDCVVGNPPYIRIQTLDKNVVRYLSERYASAKGKFDIYIPFLEQGKNVLRTGGQLGLIVPNKFMTADYGKAIREIIAPYLRKIVDFESTLVFPGASTYCCLVFLGNRRAETVEVVRGVLTPAVAREISTLSPAELGAAPWSLRRGNSANSTNVIPLRSVCKAIFQGLITGSDSLLIGVRNGDYVHFAGGRVRPEPGILMPLLKGPDVQRFALHFSGHYVIYPYKEVAGHTELMTESEIAARYPETYRYLCQNKEPLIDRGSEAMRYRGWYAHWCPRTLGRFASAKIVTQVLASRASFALDLEGQYTFVGGGNAGVYGIIPTFASEERLLLLLGILNSKAFDKQVQARTSRFRGNYFSFARRFIEDVAIPRVAGSDITSEAAASVIILVRRRLTARTPGEVEQLDAEIDALVDGMYNHYDAFI